MVRGFRPVRVPSHWIRLVPVGTTQAAAPLTGGVSGCLRAEGDRPREEPSPFLGRPRPGAHVGLGVVAVDQVHVPQLSRNPGPKMVPGPLGVLVFSLVEWVRVCLCVGHSV